MRDRDRAIRKSCPPHQWKMVHDDDVRDGGCLYAARRCDVCKAREHAIITSDVLAATPKTLWHLADAPWTAV